MRLAWCDRIALICGGSLLIILACAWRGTWVFWDGASPPFWSVAWEIGWRIVGVPWLILRLIDFVLGGPLRREPGLLRRLLIRRILQRRYERMVEQGLIPPKVIELRAMPPPKV